MKTLVLDGSVNSDPITASIRTALADELSARGAELEYVLASEKKIANCQGDFFCWVRSPGICAIDDDNRAIARSFMNSDLVVLLTPVTFGGYSSQLKRAVDHLIQNILPFFAMLDGEIHHRRRYPRYPRLLVIGWLSQADAASEAIFRHLVYRNGINMHAPSTVSGVVYSAQAEADVCQSLKNFLEAVLLGQKQARAALPSPDETPILSGFGAPRRALLLVGSPRGKTSTSHALGTYLFEQLASQGLQTETIRLYTMLRSETQMQALLEAVNAADLVTLAFPLYVDALPGPVMRVLEEIASYCRENPQVHPQRFSAIVNSGFPESAQNDTALAICRDFARLTGFAWAGGLKLGGGEGVVHGTPLDQLDGRAIPLKRSLEMAARSLAAGAPIPPEAVALLAKPVVPAWLYWLVGGYGWRRQAKQYNVQKQLMMRPYEIK